MNVKTPCEIDLDAERNLVRIRYSAHVTIEHMTKFHGRVVSLLGQLRKGFVAVTDLTDLDEMDLECAPVVTKIMDACRTAGLGTVIRIIPDPNKDIGFNILTTIHYRTRIPVITCETRAEAEQAIATSLRSKH
jgi:hypothetical protein